MAPQHTSSSSDHERDISLAEMVFACNICQATVSDIYATKDDHLNFKGSSDKEEDGIVTKLWIGACSHIFCGRHLEGGGAPFHPTKHPEAQCPVCVRVGNEPTKTSLYGIRGFDAGEYDSIVPDAFLRCPPLILDNLDEGMDGLRFQYSNLGNYAKRVTENWRAADRKRHALEKAMHKERKQWRRQEAEFKDRIAVLEKSEAKLKKWEQRRDMINHYLGLVAKMGEDIKVMRGQLLEFGFNVPEKQYAFEQMKSKQSESKQDDSHQATRGDTSGTFGRTQQRTSSSHLKRKHSPHDDYTDDKENRPLPTTQSRQNGDLMPPPLPKVRPPQRPPSPSSQAGYRHDPRVQQPQQPVFQDQPWQDYREDIPMEYEYDQPHQFRQQPHHHDHGALPFRPSQEQHFEHQPQSQDYIYDAPPVPPPTQRQGLLSRPPRRRGQQYVCEQGSEAVQPPPSQARGGQIHDFNEVYGTMSQQLEDNVPRVMAQEMAPPSRSQPTNNVLGTPSLRKPLEPLPNAVASPFFGRQSAQNRPDTMQRPPARGSMMQPPAPPSRSNPAFRPPGPAARGPAAPMLYGRNIHGNGMPPPSSRGNQYQNGTSQGQHVHSDMPQRNTYSSQAPLMSDGVFQRQPNPASFGRAFSQTRSFSHTQGGRMTVQPNRSQMSGMGSQDARLSHIPGVRGTGLSQPSFNRPGLGNAYNASRSLYSSASRRAVQR